MEYKNSSGNCVSKERRIYENVPEGWAGIGCFGGLGNLIDKIKEENKGKRPQ